MRRKFSFIFVSLLFITSFILPVKAEDKVVNLYFFHAQGCLTCAAEAEYLDTLLARDSSLVLHKYEIAFDKDNQAFVKEISGLLPVEINSTPSIVIGQKVIVGFVEGVTDVAIQDEIEYAKTHVIKDVIGEVLGIVDVTDAQIVESSTVTLPIFGTVEAKSISLPLLAVVIGALDGFNPCAMWVLLLLISMLFHLEERWKRWFLGSIFLGTTAIMYLFFMVSWLNITILFGTLGWIRLLIAAIALAGGGFNIYRYLTTKPGCEVMDDKKRKKVSERVKQIAKEPVFALAIVGVIVLAISINLVEMICSAGLPVLFTQVLSLNHLNTFETGLYLFIYVLFFMIDDVIIFVIAMKTSELTGMSNKYARTAHLIGGIVMILIAILMVFRPEWLMFNFGI